MSITADASAFLRKFQLSEPTVSRRIYNAKPTIPPRAAFAVRGGIVGLGGTKYSRRHIKRIREVIRKKYLRSHTYTKTFVKPYKNICEVLCAVLTKRRIGVKMTAIYIVQSITRVTERVRIVQKERLTCLK